MNFASLNFAWFLPLALLGYWNISKTNDKNIFLLLISYYFYACWDPRFLFLIWFLTGASYYSGSRIILSNKPAQKKLVLKIYVAVSLGVLAIFKYFNFFVDAAQQLISSAGVNSSHLHLSIVLPAAISFFTFESLSYVIEIYHGDLKSQPKLRNYALFIAFFPKLVAGPIERPAVLLPQLEQTRAVGIDNVTRGLFLIAIGLFKKIAIADGLAPAVDSIYGSPQPVSATDITLATLAFTFQIYCDFSGYSDIARGISKLFGLELSQNFKFPYFSSNPSEFWRRWHISLSTWLRDYLYIPLGGNRYGEKRARVNLMITMALGGLWHGAAWNYVLWGIYQGGLLVAYRMATQSWAPTHNDRPSIGPAFKTIHTLISANCKRIFFILLMCYGWLLFRANSISQVISFTHTLLAGPYPAETRMKNIPLSATLGIIILIINDAAAYRTGDATFYRKWRPITFGALIAAVLFATLMGLSNARSAFIYFQF
jgi:alginate O-acetyltransferase complex protein AlgI